MKTAYPIPNWHKTAIATDRGWVAPETNELLVSFRGLKTKIELELKLNSPVVEPIADVAPAIEENGFALVELKTEIINSLLNTIKSIEKKEVIMEQDQEVKTKRTYNKKPKVIGEVVEQPADRKVLAEVVEYDLETKVIGE